MTTLETTPLNKSSEPGSLTEEKLEGLRALKEKAILLPVLVL